VYKQINVEPQPLSERLPHAPRELCLLTHAMLSKRPERRPTMQQVANALEPWDSGDSDQRRPIVLVPSLPEPRDLPPPPQASQRAVDSPSRLGLWALALALLLLGAVAAGIAALAR
jgi:hypothetical protein